MDSRTFWAEIVKALAWPIAAVVLAGLVRGPARGLVHGLRLKKVKRGDWEAEFDESAAEVRAGLPERAKHPSPKPSTEAVIAEREALLDASPTGAVLTAWKEIEAEVTALAVREGLGVHSFQASVDQLAQRKVLTPDVRNSIQGLRQLRNLAVHGPSDEVSPRRAREFVAMAEAILWIIRDQKKVRGT